jgi:RNA recognition motif-containing protein
MNIIDILKKIDDASQIIKKQFSSSKLNETMKSITNQLDFIKNDLEKSKPYTPTANRKDVERIIIGLQAVREVESQNEELADLLCDIDYEYKKLYGISIMT